MVIWAAEAEPMMGQGLQVDDMVFASNWRGFCINFLDLRIKKTGSCCQKCISQDYHEQ